MKKPIFAAIVVGVLSLTTLVGWRGYYGGSMDPAKVSRIVGARVDNVLDDVDATDNQRTQIKGITEQLVKDGLELRKGSTETRKELLTQWDSATPDRNRVHALVDERAEQFKGFAHKVVDAALQIHGILTPKQRASLSEDIKERIGE